MCICILQTDTEINKDLSSERAQEQGHPNSKEHPNTKIVVSKYHPPLKEPQLPGETVD